ncbi:DNA replication factor Cdt1-like [Oscarella lobularis]|uniref:DNA replication factor Cdt1-like n=1 Tax=Oscarella lobularis TaxID=121494 RepID=UPI003313BB0D
MAARQSTINVHFPARKRASGSHPSAKRRKTHEDSLVTTASPSSKAKTAETPSKPESIKKSSSLVSLASQRRKAQDLRDQSRRNDEIEPNRLEKRYQSMANDLKAASSRDLMERKRIVGKSSGYPEPMHFGKRQLETEKPDRVDLNSLGSGIPAYQKFEHLVRKESSVALELPQNYKSLAEKFHCVDTVVSLMGKRNETCTFHKLKSSVQEMSRKSFVEKNLGQMKTVFPTAYHFGQVKGLPWYGAQKEKPDYQLTVDINPFAVEELERDGAVRQVGVDEKKPVTTSLLLKRRTVFNRRLLGQVRKHHREFLASKEVSIPDDQIRRWHPEFRLDQVPHVESSPLPEPPVVKRYSTASDMLETARAGMAPPKVIEALESTAAKAKKCLEIKREDTKVLSVDKVTPTEEKTKNSALNGVCQSLIEKIRAKERRRVEEEMTRDPATERQLSMMERLPEMCHILRSLFVSEKRGAIPWDSVIPKLQDSCSSGISQVAAGDHLELLRDVVPDWLTIITIRGTRYVKLNRNADTGKVIDKIRTKQSALRSKVG